MYSSKRQQQFVDSTQPEKRIKGDFVSPRPDEEELMLAKRVDIANFTERKNKSEIFMIPYQQHAQKRVVFKSPISQEQDVTNRADSTTGDVSDDESNFNASELAEESDDEVDSKNNSFESSCSFESANSRKVNESELETGRTPISAGSRRKNASEQVSVETSSLRESADSERPKESDGVTVHDLEYITETTLHDNNISHISEDSESGLENEQSTEPPSSSATRISAVSDQQATNVNTEAVTGINSEVCVAPTENQASFREPLLETDEVAPPMGNAGKWPAFCPLACAKNGVCSQFKSHGDLHPSFHTSYFLASLIFFTDIIKHGCIPSYSVLYETICEKQPWPQFWSGVQPI